LIKSLPLKVELALEQAVLTHQSQYPPNNGNEIRVPLGSILFHASFVCWPKHNSITTIGILGGSFTTHNCAQKPPIRQKQNLSH
jgi:hypothetical protein